MVVGGALGGAPEALAPVHVVPGIVDVVVVVVVVADLDVVEGGVIPSEGHPAVQESAVGDVDLQRAVPPDLKAVGLRAPRHGTSAKYVTVRPTTSLIF